MLGRPMLGRFVPMLGRPLMLGREPPSVDLPPPTVETLSLEGLDEAAAMDVRFVGAMDEREEADPATRELRDALDTAASVVRLRAAMLVV